MCDNQLPAPLSRLAERKHIGVRDIANGSIRLERQANLRLVEVMGATGVIADENAAVIVEACGSGDIEESAQESAFAAIDAFATDAAIANFSIAAYR